MSAVATAANERPVFFRGAGEDLFGIITEPTTPSNGCALVLVAGGDVPAPNRNGLSVRIARRVAALGYHALRFDYHGVGESSGTVDKYRLDSPFVEDVLAGVRCLEANGIREIVLMGTCFGARGALASAAQVPQLRGVVLLAAPTRDFEMGTPGIEATPTSHYMKRALRPSTLGKLRSARGREFVVRVLRTKLRAARSRRKPASSAAAEVSPQFAKPLTKLGARGTAVLLAYGTGDEFYGPFRAARPALAAALEAPGSRIEERLVPGRIHGLATLAVQDEISNLVESWLAELDGAGSRAP